eukprot:PLAT8052.1.p1 GENE.PLAT8052.1~~PLAT8052.1.p1  ORF type:complete len:399 (+),score=113.50 PLAT8052.1:31-1197(+)
MLPADRDAVALLRTLAPLGTVPAIQAVAALKERPPSATESSRMAALSQRRALFNEAQLAAGKSTSTPLPDALGRDAASGKTLLHNAAENGHPDLAAMLLDEGAVVDAAARNGETPLFKAINQSSIRLRLVRVLLAAGADPLAPNKWGDTPLSMASKSQDKQAAYIMLRAGAKLHPSSSVVTSQSRVRRGTVGMEASFTVQGRNIFRGAMRRGGAEGVAILRHLTKPLSSVIATAVDDGSGSYAFAYTADVEGRYELSVQLNGSHIHGSPFNITVLPADSDSSGEAAGDGEVDAAADGEAKLAGDEAKEGDAAASTAAGSTVDSVEEADGEAAWASACWQLEKKLRAEQVARVELVRELQAERAARKKLEERLARVESLLVGGVPRSEE